jgi:hypothetical protein
VSRRDRNDAHLINAAPDVHRDDSAFGYRLIADELPARGIIAGETKVARLCSADIDAGNAPLAHPDVSNAGRRGRTPDPRVLFAVRFWSAVEGRRWGNILTKCPGESHSGETSVRLDCQPC